MLIKNNSHSLAKKEYLATSGHMDMSLSGFLGYNIGIYGL